MYQRHERSRNSVLVMFSSRTAYLTIVNRGGAAAPDASGSFLSFWSSSSPPGKVSMSASSFSHQWQRSLNCSRSSMRSLSFIFSASSRCPGANRGRTETDELLRCRRVQGMRFRFEKQALHHLVIYKVVHTRSRIECILLRVERK